MNTPLGKLTVTGANAYISGIKHSDPDTKFGNYDESLPSFKSSMNLLKKQLLIDPRLNCVDSNFSVEEEWMTVAISVKNQLVRYFRGELQDFQIPFYDFSGTDLQNDVWSEMLSIPYGHTTSYKKIAEAISRPKSFRPVGGAVGRNPWSIAIPCHRVIGSSGKLVGYASGLSRKSWLLAHEARVFGS
ncbi:MAG: methylated-DNA--[protein]-cysteine S-methyltransferase [Dehalococcoidia bacterium]|nr:methylated-DNA--[protein]-cysteine S-methyltransferase [Dehalococcoidia bacterium]